MKFHTRGCRDLEEGALYVEKAEKVEQVEKSRVVTIDAF